MLYYPIRIATRRVSTESLNIQRSVSIIYQIHTHIAYIYHLSAPSIDRISEHSTLCIHHIPKCIHILHIYIYDSVICLRRVSTKSLNTPRPYISPPWEHDCMRTILYHSFSHYTIPHYTTPYRTVLYCIIIKHACLLSVDALGTRLYVGQASHNNLMSTMGSSSIAIT